MRNNLRIRMILSLLFIIPIESEFERFDGLTALNAWHEDRYEAYNDAENTLREQKMIVVMRHGSGSTYRLTQTGIQARIDIKRLLSL